MSEDLTRNLPNSFEQRVLAELTAIRQENAQLSSRMTSFEDRMTSFEDRMISIEDRMTSIEGRMTALEDRIISVEGRLTSVENRLVSLEDRSLSIDTRLTSLEDKVDARLRETRPIWEGVQVRLTEIEKGLSTLNYQFKTMIREAFDLRTRVEKLEDDQHAV
jgi:predicted nuclease with TOPRIM domain